MTASESNVIGSEGPLGDPGSPVAIVTGASAGIGRVICLQLAQRGYRVVAAARSSDKLS